MDNNTRLLCLIGLGFWIALMVRGPQPITIQAAALEAPLAGAVPTLTPLRGPASVERSIPSEPPLAPLPDAIRRHLALAGGELDRRNENEVAELLASRPVPERAMLEDMRAYHRRMVAKHPEAIEPRFEYARFLLFAEDYDGAAAVYREILNRSPDNHTAQKLAEQVERVRGAADEITRVQAKVEVLHLCMEVAPSANEPLSDFKLTTEEQGRVRARMASDSRYLHEKYADKLIGGGIYEAPFEERMRSFLPLRYEREGEYRAAEELYRSLLDDYPASPRVRADYARFLLRQHRYTDAERFVTREWARFPRHLDLAVIRDRILTSLTDDKLAAIDDQIRYDLALLTGL